MDENINKKKLSKLISLKIMYLNIEENEANWLKVQLKTKLKMKMSSI